MRTKILKWMLGVTVGMVFGFGVWEIGGSADVAKVPARRDTLGWAPSVYYAESVADCSLEKAWKLMLDYEAWNPTFVGAKVIPVRGKPRTEGEVVLIQKALKDVHGQPLSEFYAETVKVVPQRHIVWYTYPKEGESRRNFVDFGLSEVSSGVKFSIYY